MIPCWETLTTGLAEKCLQSACGHRFPIHVVSNTAKTTRQGATAIAFI